MRLKSWVREILLTLCTHPPTHVPFPLQQDIGKRVEEKISKDQRRYFLMEQVI